MADHCTYLLKACIHICDITISTIIQYYFFWLVCAEVHPSQDCSKAGHDGQHGHGKRDDFIAHGSGSADDVAQWWEGGDEHVEPANLY